MKNRRNYYRVLQVQPDASLEVIKSSYRTLMQKLKHHPDLGGDQWNAALINEAFGVLRDRDKRAAYDRELQRLLANVGPNHRSPGGEHDVAPKRTAGPIESTSGPPASRDSCLFCGSPAPATSYTQSSQSCILCQSPLTITERWDSINHERQAHRITQTTQIRFWLRNGDPALQGLVRDLSPTGLRLITRTRIDIGAIVKLENTVLSAVAEVIRQMQDAQGRYDTGVKFLGLKLKAPTGTFVTTRA